MNIAILDLINRLQAEKEELVGNIDELKAENERLTQFSGILLHNGSKLFAEIETAKAEAYKEFAERLKGILTPYPDCDFKEKITSKQIDSLLKELVGESSESKSI